MATIEKRGAGQFRATVRRKGHEHQRRTFPTRQLAEKWARDIESKMDAGEPVLSSEAQRTTLAEALDRYARERSARKRGARQELRRIAAWRRHPLSRLPLARLRGADLADYRDARLAGVALERYRAARAAGEIPTHGPGDPRPVGADSVRLELAIVSNLYRVAALEWGMAGLANPAKAVAKPQAGAERDRRLSGDEEARLLQEAPPALRWAIILAVETAMRRSELAGLRRERVDLVRRVVTLHETKNGTPRRVPLSPRAVEVLREIPVRIDGYVFGPPRAVAEWWTHGFRELCARLAIDGLRFHDLRHEAISRLFERGWSVAEVAAVSGHKTWSQLRRYTQLRAEALAAKLAA